LYNFGRLLKCESDLWTVRRDQRMLDASSSWWCGAETYSETLIHVFHWGAPKRNARYRKRIDVGPV
jgi:hypothetical protein